jgi:hypothetical protein
MFHRDIPSAMAWISGTIVLIVVPGSCMSFSVLSEIIRMLGEIPGLLMKVILMNLRGFCAWAFVFFRNIGSIE